MTRLNYKYQRRILSILIQHQLLFGSGIVNYSKETQKKIEELISSINKNELGQQKINKIISIIRQHSLLFGHGVINKNQQTIERDYQLIRYLKKLLREEGHYSIIPRVNYLNFKRKTSERIRIRKTQPTVSILGGLPLFGKKRIPTEKIKNGYLILFSTPSHSPFAFIHIILINERGKIKYRGEKSVIDSDGYIHTIIITNKPLNTHNNNYIKTIFGTRVKLTNLLTIRTKNNSLIYITGNPYYSYIKQKLVGDPTLNQLSFFFPITAKPFTQITQFLTKLIKQFALISNAEADNISYFVTKKIFTQNGTPTHL